jgi:hypothetical protein
VNNFLLHGELIPPGAQAALSPVVMRRPSNRELANQFAAKP